jgi:O-antigen ligase
MSICVIALWYTKSFGGFLGLTTGTGVLFMFLPDIKLKYLLPTFLLIAIIGILILSTQPKFKNIVNNSERNSLTTRLQIWEISIAVLKQHPVLGVGLGNFQAPYRVQAYKMYQPPLEWEVVKAHNLYLNLWLEVGLLGLLTFFGMLLVYAKEIKKLLQSKSTYELWWLVGGTLGALISILTHGLLDTPFFKNDLSILFLFVFCLPFILSKIKTQISHID